jgi:transposase-like protein
VRSGTIFHDSHLPLWKWFLAVFIMVESKKGVSANQLKRMLGVADKTAWYLCHRIRATMTQDGEPLRGTVEADETYVGGRHRRDYRKAHKTVVLGALERGGNLKLRVAPSAEREHIHKFLADTIDGDAEAIYTDSHRSYLGIADHNTRHEFVNHAADEWVRGDVHTNSIEGAWGLFDRSVIGSYHRLSVKHLPAYLDEFAFRFNNRENPHLFRDTILRLIESDTLTYKELVAAK